MFKNVSINDLQENDIRKLEQRVNCGQAEELIQQVS